MTLGIFTKAAATSALVLAFFASAGMPAAAETGKVRIAEQFGLLYLPQNIVHERKLIQKHAVAAGLPEPKVELLTISGGANINKALLSGNLDFAAVGIGPLLKLWGKSEGRFKGAISMSDMPLKLVTNDPKVKTIKDYLTVEDHKIAMPAAGVSIQAQVLQMAAQKLWNEPNKLDHLVVSMKHPTAVAAMLSGGQAVKSHFATLPYSYEELHSGKIHLVLSSYDLLGSSHTTVAMITGKEFKEKNPKTYKAVVDAYAESYDWIYKNPDEAVKIFVKATKSKLDPKAIRAMIGDKQEIEYSAVPKHTKEFADFLHKTGDIPAAKSWKDYFWENAHGQAGS
jgi:NitT/TauT family transport system substrate-binding protein